MAKKKNSSDTRGMNSEGKSVTYKGKKVDFSQPSKLKPTEAITAKGQKATGVSGKNPNIAAVGKGIKEQQKSQRTLNALEKIAGAVTQTALMAGASGAVSAIGKQATIATAKKLGVQAFQRTGGAAWAAGSRNLAGATGKGGKVARTMTPFGPTLRSTAIGSPAQQKARMSGLEKVYENLAVRSGKIAQTEKIVSSMKTGRNVTQGASVLGAAAAGVAGKKVNRKNGGRGTAKKK